jgi:hypothetical protein
VKKHQYRITWKRTHKASASPDWPQFVEVFTDDADEIEQIPIRFRTFHGFASKEIEIVSVERLS